MTARPGDSATGAADLDSYKDGARDAAERLLESAG
jgi:hypothetical protein